VTDSPLRFRPYDPRDETAAWRLHERALRAAGTDPGDVPGADDLRRITDTYLEAGGAFLVGIDRDRRDPGDGPDATAADGVDTLAPPTFDGALVAMGGFVPAAAGRAEERDVAAAGVAELRRMRVAPARQREGHGSALLAELERRAREAGFERLLATTATRQRAATRFYPVRGYRETGRSIHGDYELVHFRKDLS